MLDATESNNTGTDKAAPAKDIRPTNLQILGWYQNTVAMLQNPQPRPTKFNYALMRNKHRLEILVTAFNETLKASQSPEFTELQTIWREEIQPKYSLPNGAIDQMRAREFDAECMAKAEENPDWVKASQEQRVTLDELHAIQVDFTPYKLSADLLPEMISGAELMAVEYMLDFEGD